MEKTFVQMMRESLQSAHETLEGTMQGATEEVLHWQPQGKALPVGAAYAHAVISEDLMLSGMVRKTKSLLDQGWIEKLGLSHPHPMMDESWEKNFAEWAKTVKMDLPKFKEYAKAVYKQSDEYLGTLTDKDLSEKKVDLSGWGLGEWSLGKFVMRLLMGHMDNLTGEVSAAKGLQGLKGYPF